MKKILFVIIIYIVTLNNTYANGSCLIQNNTAKFLGDYIKDTREEIIEITNLVLTKTSDNKKKGNLKKEVTKFYNSLTNWNGYYSYFQYYVSFPISNEIPFPINRDYRKIENELKGLNSYYYRIVKKGYGDDPEIGLKVKQKIIDFENLINNYRLAVMGDELIGDSEHNENLIKYYGDNATQKCSLNEGGFSRIIKDKISNIKGITKDTDQAIKKWKDAWDMLVGNSSDESYFKLEKELLARELSRQGIPMGQRQRMLNQLENYNKNGISLDNNFITNTFTSTFKNINSQLKRFKKDIFDDFKNDTVNTTNPYEKKINIDEILKNKDQNEVDLNITQNITTLYENEVNLASQSDISLDKLTSRIINLHSNLKESINVLNETCETSVKVCNQQDSGNGNCGQCN